MPMNFESKFNDDKEKEEEATHVCRYCGVDVLESDIHLCNDMQKIGKIMPATIENGGLWKKLPQKPDEEFLKRL